MRRLEEGERDMVDFRIRKRSDSCEACETPFEPEQVLVSFFELNPDEPRRLDLCEACAERREPDPERDFARWKTRFRPEGPERRPVDFRALTELFLRMAERPSPEYRKLTYLLGLLLVRKRSLKLLEFVTERGRDYLLVQARGADRALRIEAPELAHEEFQSLRDRLRTLLDLDLGEWGDDARAAPEPEGAAS